MRKKLIFLQLICLFGYLSTENICLDLETKVKLDSDIVAIDDIISVNEKIFILDKISKGFIVLSLNGEVEKSVFTQGKGLGEFGSPICIFNDAIKRCIGISDNTNRKILYFNYSGDFVEEKKYQEMNTMIKMDIIDYNSKIEFWKNIDFSDGNMSLNPIIKLVTSSKDVILFSGKFKLFEMDFEKHISPIYAYRNNSICIAEKSQDNYQITIYDTNAKEKCKVSKVIRKKIKRETEEIEEIEKSYEKVGKKLRNHQYKNIIENILISDRNNLWVLVNNESGNSFEIYDLNGNKLCSIVNNREKFENCILYKNKLYEISGNENDGFILNIYQIIGLRR